MEISYQRSANASYMILPQEFEVKAYEEQMLINNEIPYLLTFFGRRIDDKRQLWYDITSKKSFRSFCGNSLPERDELVSIFRKIMFAFKGLKEYLISDDRIFLSEDTLYLSGRGDNLKVFLCFYPKTSNLQNGRTDLQQQLMGLYEFLMPLTERGDDTLAKLIYEGYELLCDEAFSLDEWEKSMESLPEHEYNEYSVPENDCMSYTERREPDTEKYNTFQDVCTEGQLYKEKEQDTERRRAILDELFEDDEEEMQGIKERFSGFFKGLKDGISTGVRRKKEDYFPPRDLEEDLIFDPSAVIPAPSALMQDNENTCFGKLIYEGCDNEKDYVIDKDSSMVGSRDKNNEVLLHSAAVSRHHAMIKRREKKFYLEDLGSTNGTFLNGKHVKPGKPVELRYMDRISFADVCYMIL